LSLTEFTRMLGDLAEIAVTILLAYVVYKIAILIDTFNCKIKKEKSP